MYIEHTYTMPKAVEDHIRGLTPRFGFNGFGELIYNRTYSRIMDNGRQEQWPDTIIRVVNGVMSIRKSHMIEHHLPWNDDDHHRFVGDFATSMFNMEFLPPGRGLWAMGTDYVRERGAMALYNCAATETTLLSRDAAWLMDCCMCGVGVGFGINPYPYIMHKPQGHDWLTYVIPDTREGWVESVRRLIESYETGGKEVRFNYDMIRAKGEPIRGFGGVSSGSEPLQKLHARLRTYLDDYAFGRTSTTRLIADTMNAIGSCVVAGNVRRSAEIAIGRVHDQDFLNLKNYDLYPERMEIGGLSNNSVALWGASEFDRLKDIAERIIDNGEPGFINMMNVRKYGRMFEKSPDLATLCNPCGEIPLRSKETCNLAETFPTRCSSHRRFTQAAMYAAFYASTVALLPTHSEETNRVLAENRRIGVSISGVADWMSAVPSSVATKVLRKNYESIVAENARLAQEAGVPKSVRVTTVKPSGTISLLAGVSPGMHWPTFTYTLRRVRVAETSPILETLIQSGMPYEKDLYSDQTLVFTFPIKQDSARPAQDVSMWQQASRVSMLQREYADNMVSNTVYFDPEREARDVEHLLAEYAPIVKTMSLLPHTEQGAYEQMPNQGVTKAVYEQKLSELKPIDWSKFSGSDGMDERYCNNEGCAINFG